MSAETEHEEVQTVETPEAENADTGLTGSEEEAVSWDEVPEPEEEPGEDEPEPEPGNADPAKQEVQSSPGNAKGNSEDADSGDEFSFLNDLDEDSGVPAATGAEPEAVSEPEAEEFNADELLGSLEDPDMKNFAEDFPDEAKFVAKLIHRMQTGGKANEQLKRIAALEQYVNGEREQLRVQEAQNAQNAFEQAVLKIHPDAKEIMTEHRKEFADWLKKQPVYLQRRFRDSSDPEEAADILTRYKEGAGRQTAAYKRRTGLYRGFGSGGKANPRGGDDPVGWNSIRSEDVPEY